MSTPLRLVERASSERLERMLEGLLVVASRALTLEELAEGAGADPEAASEALARVGERFSEGRSGIVLEQVAGGYALRASVEAAEACASLYERPSGRGLTQAALETLAIVAYLGPCTRAEIARLRGVSVDGVVAGLLERGLLAEDGRSPELGAVRYRTTPLFERVFGLGSLAELPRLGELDAAGLRERLQTAASRRVA